MNRPLSSLLAALAIAIAPAAAQADILAVQVGNTVTKYEGVIIQSERYNHVERVDFGSIASEQFPAAPTSGSTPIVLMVNGELFENCLFRSSRYLAQRVQFLHVVCGINPGGK